MVAPWAGFGTFLFERDEQPIFGTDLGWNRRSPSIDRRRPLGSATDSIVTLAVGSADRTFEIHVTPSRCRDLETLVNTSATFTDWERPYPDSRPAFLASVVRLGLVRVQCSDGVTVARWRVAITLISQ